MAFTVLHIGTDTLNKTAIIREKSTGGGFATPGENRGQRSRREMSSSAIAADETNATNRLGGCQTIKMRTDLPSMGKTIGLSRNAACC
jgi:hypothetical protein